jgi:putative hydrolase of the HAD superfamily
VTFDIDDTLYLERDYVRSGFRAVGERCREELGIEGFFDRAVEAFEAGVRRTIFDHVLATYGVEDRPELIRSLVEAYRSHDPEIRLAPDSLDCLERLHGHVELAAVSDGPATSQHAKTTALGLRTWLDPILITEDLGPEYWKPNARAFQLVQAETGCMGRQCVYVADNPEKDFAGPKALGWRTVRVRRPESLQYQAESCSCVDLEVTDLSGLEDNDL